MRLRVLCLIVVFAAMPAAARAQGGFLDFMEQWSGPGPFNYGPSFSVRLGCQIAKDAGPLADPDKRKFVGLFQHDVDADRNSPRSCAVRSRNVLAFLELRYMRGSMDDRHPLFSDRPAELVTDHARGINLSSNVLQALLMKQVVDPAFAVGFGAGLAWFDGTLIDGSPKRIVLTPLAIDVAPLRLFFPTQRWARALVFQFEESAFVVAVDAKKFASTSTSAYTAHAELFRTFNVNFDVLSLLFEQ